MNPPDPALADTNRGADSPAPAGASPQVATDSTAHGSGTSLAAGFALSLVLTAIPFALVMTGALPRGLVLPAIVAAAVLQIAVHLSLFLHLDTKSEGGWNALAFGATLLITVIFLAGSVWIMHNLDRNMMSMPMPDD
jgi:cytochrome o ubiquinol oxidase operon protein cyoD